MVFEKLDIRSLKPACPAFADARYVFHFVGIGDIVPPIDAPIDYRDTNAMGTVRVLKAAQAACLEMLVVVRDAVSSAPTEPDHGHGY